MEGRPSRIGGKNLKVKRPSRWDGQSIKFRTNKGWEDEPLGEAFPTLTSIASSKDA